QLGAPAGGAFAEITPFEEERVISARSSIDCHPDSGCAASHDDDVPFRSMRTESIEHFRPCHFVLLSVFVPSPCRSNLRQAAGHFPFGLAPCLGTPECLMP